jgi:hypothetical protein
MTSSVDSVLDALFAAGLFVALYFGKAPPWLVVIIAALASPVLGL